MKIKVMFSLIPVLVLVGCADRVSLAEQKMQEIRSQPAQPVKPPPVPEQIEDFTYAAAQFRSPFMPPSLMIAANQALQVKGVKPDDKRIREPLEAFELNQLIFKGIMVSISGEKFGMVQRPDGTMATVKVGNYMGKNYGRIVEITPTQINMIEIVPDARAGFVEKPASLIASTN